jgi:hypothetical protein
MVVVDWPFPDAANKNPFSEKTTVWTGVPRLKVSACSPVSVLKILMSPVCDPALKRLPSGWNAQAVSAGKGG